jgi:NAD(P)-dependent dehydrogenase (short-subunit alcohol dehydrogenase family)
MFFRQRAAAHAALSYLFGCAGIGRAVAVDVVDGDEDWFIAEGMDDIVAANLRGTLPAREAA